MRLECLILLTSAPRKTYCLDPPLPSTTFLNAIQSTIIKQYLEVAAIWPHCLSGPIILQITAKYFNLEITV